MGHPEEKPNISPFGYRDGPALSGPADPVLIWMRAREVLGITELADPQQMEQLKVVYRSLCAQIREKGEDAVIDTVGDSSDENVRWQWRKEQRPDDAASPKEQVYVERAGEGTEDVIFGEMGRYALTEERLPTSEETQE